MSINEKKYQGDRYDMIAIFDALKLSFSVSTRKHGDARGAECKKHVQYVNDISEVPISRYIDV